MTKQEIHEKIVPFFTDEFEIDEVLITPDANLRETLQLDSLDYVDLVVAIEGHFSFKVQQTDFQSIITFDDLYSYIHSKIHQQESAVPKSMNL